MYKKGEKNMGLSCPSHVMMSGHSFTAATNVIKHTKAH